MSDFKFGQSSLEKLKNLNDPLKNVVMRALELSTLDFSVVETLRAMARQLMLVKTGASKTLKSRHLADPKTKKANAVDLAAYLDTDGDGDKELSWHWGHAYQVAKAMRAAAIELGINVRWGGVWDKNLNDLSEDLESEVAHYVLRQKKRQADAGKADQAVFVDGPHFELPAV